MRSRTAYRRRRPFGDGPAFRSQDVRAELGFLLGRLQASGIEQCVAVDLTHPEWGIPVVRLRIAGLSPYCVNMRRAGPRCLRHLL
jgi:ribosomal protein S12 methylthiotransferase accessory factor